MVVINTRNYYLRPALLWDVTPYRLVVIYRQLGKSLSTLEDGTKRLSRK